MQISNKGCILQYKLKIMPQEQREKLESYSFTSDDIDLITYALRQLSKSTGFANIKTQAEDLIKYTELQKNEKE